MTAIHLRSLLILLLLSTTLSATAQRRVVGNGNVRQETRRIANFQGISAGSAFQVFLVKGNQPGLRLEADENVLPYIETRVTGSGTLEIGFQNMINLHNVKSLRAYVTYTELNSIDLSGAASLEADHTVEADRMTLDLSGASRTTLQLRCRELRLEASGASKAILTGQAAEVWVDASGASKLELLDLSCSTAQADLSGASKLSLNVTQRLIAEISGAGKLDYRGRPRTLEVETSGAGKVQSMN